jgi:hypothetical protein
MRVEAALTRVVEKCIAGHPAIGSGALFEHRAGQKIELRLRQVEIGSLDAGIHSRPQFAEPQGRPIDTGKGAGNDAVIIFLGNAVPPSAR